MSIEVSRSGNRTKRRREAFSSKIHSSRVDGLRASCAGPNGTDNRRTTRKVPRSNAVSDWSARLATKPAYLVGAGIGDLQDSAVSRVKLAAEHSNCRSEQRDEQRRSARIDLYPAACTPIVAISRRGI